MNLEEIKAKLQTADYDFLRINSKISDNLILLGLGGSYAYGTNVASSDIDLRGVATNSKRNVLIGQDFEQVVDVQTDTTVYSFDKIIKLLCNCNPNTIEILGLKPEHYLYVSPIGKQLLGNKTMFLSKAAVYSFGGYANAQLRRLENKAARQLSQSGQENYILKSIEHAMVDYKQKYFEFPDDAIKLYIGKSNREEYETEIFMDLNLKAYPLRDYKGMWSEMNAIVKSYAKIGARNAKAIAKDKLGKHMMHLVRLYLMCFDILEKQEIITYRENEHSLLMSIRNGEYLNESGEPTVEFYEMVDELEKRLDYDKDNTSLPDKVDVEKIHDFVASVNESIVLN